jgi:aldehyde dehydrogenase (NAD+)
MRRNGRNGQATDGIAWEYAPAPEARNIVKIQPRYGLFIGGEFVEPHSGRYFETINPATEETLAEVAYADAEDIDRAVQRCPTRLRDRLGQTAPARSAPSTCFGLPASCRSVHASSPCWRA